MHCALTHLCWLFTYPAAGYLARETGPPRTFTASGVFCLMTNPEKESFLTQREQSTPERYSASSA